jgi:hypothetical protein
MNKYLVIIIGVLSISLIGCVYGWKQAQKEKDRLKSNQEALLSDIVFYETKSGETAASVLMLELSISELERYKNELVKTVAELGIKLKRVESVTTSTIQSDLDVIAQLKDSGAVTTNNFNEQGMGLLRIPPLEPIPAPAIMKTFNWKDGWVSVSGTILGSEVSCRVQSLDTLTQVVHRVPHQFWFIKWGAKAIRQEMVNKNPHNKIVYTEYIQLKR